MFAEFELEQKHEISSFSFSSFYFQRKAMTRNKLISHFLPNKEWEISKIEHETSSLTAGQAVVVPRKDLEVIFDQIDFVTFIHFCHELSNFFLLSYIS